MASATTAAPLKTGMTTLTRSEDKAGRGARGRRYHRELRCASPSAWYARGGSTARRNLLLAPLVPPQDMDRPGLELAPDVVAERVGDGYVLVHLETNRIYELEGTGARFYELLRAGADLAEIERTLVAEYDAPPARIGADLDRLIAELRDARLLR